MVDQDSREANREEASREVSQEEASRQVVNINQETQVELFVMKRTNPTPQVKESLECARKRQQKRKMSPLETS